MKASRKWLPLGIVHLVPKISDDKLESICCIGAHPGIWYELPKAQNCDW